MYDDEQCLENAELYADSRGGVYIPKHFAQTVDMRCIKGFKEKSKKALFLIRTIKKLEEMEPENEEYWDLWEDVIDNCILVSSSGVNYCLYQDGDLWLVPIEN